MERPRFYVPELRPGLNALPEDQAHHARHVLRLQAGAPVELFNGLGAHAWATLTLAGKHVGAEAQDVVRDPPAAVQVSLATAVPKADRADWLVDQASQLNVWSIHWLDTDRGVVKPVETGKKLEKMRRTAVESAKQCGRNFLLAIEPMRTVEQEIQSAPGPVLWADPRRGRPAREALAELQPRMAAATPEQPFVITALIGPEGGWSERELSMLESTPGILCLRLTPTILRIETACAAVASLLNS